MTRGIMSFEDIEKAMASRETFFVGSLKGCDIDVYTRHDGSGVRILRVTWHEPNPNIPDYLRLPHGVGRRQLFGFSPKELETAIQFIDKIDPEARWKALRDQL